MSLQIENNFWQSDNAAGYPYSVEVMGTTFMFPEARSVRLGIGAYMRQEGWIPPSGSIVDFGAGNCSGLLFGEQEAKQRVIAVDYSPVLLNRSPVPRKRRIQADLRQSTPHIDESPKLVSASYLWRYLPEETQQRLTQDSQRMLAEGGRIVVADTLRGHYPELAQEMGELHEFDLDQTVAHLEASDFREVEGRVVRMNIGKVLGAQAEEFALCFATGLR